MSAAQRFDASMNGRSLASIDPDIVLVDIRQTAPRVKITTAARGNRHGQVVTNRQRESLTVELVFALRVYNPAQRDAAMTQIAAWAGVGGWLTVSTRPDQRLCVHVDAPPVVTSSLKWTEEITLTLTAYERPFWEALYPTRITTTGSGMIFVPGTVPDAYVECAITNTGTDDLTTVRVICGSTFMAFSGLSIPSGEMLRIAYTDDDLLTITAARESAMHNRSADSSDDLIVTTQRQTFLTVIADQTVSAVISARGRYL